MSKKFWRRTALVAQRSSMIAVVVLGAACASKKPKPAPAAPPAVVSAPATQSLEQYLQDAAKAASESNDKERARDIYRTAARLYPSSKEPWLKLAEDYFEGAHYGQAILAAQEVVQRDPDDSIGSSILAVSGLRVSAAALSSIQSRHGKIAGGTRNEAQTLARMLRESIGEAELVPPTAPAGTAATVSAASPAPAAATAPGPAPAPAPAARPVTRPRPPLPAKRPAPVVAPAAATPSAADDPFNILKK